MYVQATGEIGGAEVALLTFLQTVSRSEVEPLVAILRPGPLNTRIRDLGMEARLVDVGPRVRQVHRTVAGIWRLAGLARHWKADLVHSNGTKSHLYGGPAAFLAHKPYVWRLCDMLLPSTSPLYSLAAWIPANLIITDSDAVARQARAFSRRVGVTRTVYPGTPVAKVGTASEPRWLHAELDTSDTAPLVAVIGRLQPWKGQADLIRAAPRIIGAFPATHFLVVGGALFGLDPDYPQELERLVNDLGLTGRVHFLGHRGDVAHILGSVDVVVVPSRLPEPFGTIQIEAMAAGKPLVSTAAGGNVEVVEHGRTGLLVPPGNPRAIANAVCLLLGEPELRHRMGEAGRARASHRFTVERMVADMVSVYRAVLNPAAAPRQSWS